MFRGVGSMSMPSVPVAAAAAAASGLPVPDGLRGREDGRPAGAGAATATLAAGGPAPGLA